LADDLNHLQIPNSKKSFQQTNQNRNPSRLPIILYVLPQLLSDAPVKECDDNVQEACCDLFPVVVDPTGELQCKGPMVALTIVCRVEELAKWLYYVPREAFTAFECLSGQNGQEAPNCSRSRLRVAHVRHHRREETIK
jgi:hypothetical protein